MLSKLQIANLNKRLTGLLMEERSNKILDLAKMSSEISKTRSTSSLREIKKLRLIGLLSKVESMMNKALMIKLQMI